MTIAPDVIAWGNLISALGALCGVVSIGLKILSDNERQNKQISRILQELRINTECNKAALDALIQIGANGPCRDALHKLDAFLNDAAHAD